MEYGKSDGVLLNTKLVIPSVYHKYIVMRPRLYQSLEHGLQGPLTLVMAPAGFGKTTLVGEWLRQSEIQAAWVSLEVADNDPIRFWRYVLTALGELYSPIRDRIDCQPQTLQASTLEATLALLMNVLTTLPHDIVLVLDDYHCIQEPSIHQGLQFLLAHQPPLLHLCLISRTEPPLRLARLRGQGKVVELQANELLFTADEAGLFLTETMDLPLDPGEIAEIYRHTEGWAAGIQLFAPSQQRSEDTSVLYQRTLSHHYMVQYLTDEVLDRLTEAMQDFLLMTSILQYLSPDLCNALTGRHDGQEMLQALLRANLFVYPIDKQQEEGYRYTALFAELLHHRLISTRPSLVPELHRRASRWYEQHGRITEAIEHALLAHDDEQVAGLLASHAEMVLQQGDHRTIAAWLSQLPAQMVSSCALLSYLSAWVQLWSGDQREGIWQALQRAETFWRKEQHTVWLAACLNLHACQALHCEDGTRALTYVQQARELLTEKDRFVWSFLLVCEGRARLLQGDVERAQTVISAYDGLKAQNDSGIIQQAARLLCADIQRLRGNLHQALQMYQRVASQGNGLAIEARIWAGQISYQNNDLLRATEYVELLEQSNFEQCMSYESLLLAARLAWAEDRCEQAMSYLEQAEEHAQRSGPNRVALTRIAALRIQYLLAQGDLGGANRCYQHYCQSITSFPDDDNADRSPFEEEACCMMKARLAIGREQAREAIAQLKAALQRAQDQQRFDSALSLLVLLALAYHIDGDTQQTLQALDQALILGEPEYLRVFVDEGPAMAILLSEYYSRNQRRLAGEPAMPSMAYLHRLLSALGQEIRPAWLLAQTREERTLNSLSEREQMVLSLMAEGRSNQEIARALVVTVSTVKTHLNNIYAKLQVHTRLQAVTRAYDLGLLVRADLGTNTLPQLQIPRDLQLNA